MIDKMKHSKNKSSYRFLFYRLQNWIYSIILLKPIKNRWFSFYKYRYVIALISNDRLPATGYRNFAFHFFFHFASKYSIFNCILPFYRYTATSSLLESLDNCYLFDFIVPIGSIKDKNVIESRYTYKFCRKRNVVYVFFFQKKKKKEKYWCVWMFCIDAGYLSQFPTRNTAKCDNNNNCNIK